MTWAAVRWLLLMFAVAQGLEAPAIADRTEPPKPIRSWQGVASWYGPHFQGRKTSNGEIYDMYALTAAHRTLPIGSLVRVVDPQTNRGVIVRINDRGPFIDGREIDVSYEAARSLGFDHRGLARLRFELLEVPERRWQHPHPN
jgi:rare lipoprotein A (peptidoglycan hydrolase)